MLNIKRDNPSGAMNIHYLIQLFTNSNHAVERGTCPSVINGEIDWAESSSTSYTAI